MKVLSGACASEGRHDVFPAEKMPVGGGVGFRLSPAGVEFQFQSNGGAWAGEGTIFTRALS